MIKCSGRISADDTVEILKAALRYRRIQMTF